MSEALMTQLNEMLAQEHACAIRYATHAAMVSGPFAETVAARLSEIATDEIRHAQVLRDRITNLGGRPTMAVSGDDLIYGKHLDDILSINIDEEKHAIKGYVAILREISPENAILYNAIQDIIRDEQEHLEELQNLQL